MQLKVFHPGEGGGEDLYLNATLSRSLRHVSQRERSGSSQFFSTFLSSPQPRNAPRPAGRGHLRSFLQHLSRRPPRGAASARGGAGRRRSRRAGRRGRGSRAARRRGLQVAARHGDPGRSPAGLPLSPPTRAGAPAPRPPPSRRSPSLVLSNVFLPGREKLKGRTEKALCSLILRVSVQKLT